MSDVHRPFWTGSPLLVRLAVVVLVGVIVAAVVGLISQTGGGGSDAVPASRHTSTPARPDQTTAAPTTSPASATTTPPTATATPTPSPTSPARTVQPTIPPTYVVQPGDNLTVIAAWFHMHGYGALYERNKAVIGADPNLILPGQRITLTDSGVTVAS